MKEAAHQADDARDGAASGTGVLQAHSGVRWAGIFAETIALAFRNDPTWAPILATASATGTETGGASAASRRYWEFFVRSAQRFPWLGSVANGAAVSVWLPPGAAELTADEEQRFPLFATELLGREAAERIFEVIACFDDARPQGEYFYLSLLATHPNRRGAGLGMNLLRANLQQLDATGYPSYLESSNPANDARYRRLGYLPHGAIRLPSGIELTTFWRAPEQTLR